MTKIEIQDGLDEMVLRIVEHFHPEKIILFGSYARGDAGLESDVDLLVVMPVNGSRRKAAVDIGVALRDIPISKDVVVTTSDAFEWRKEVTGTIEYPAAHEGRVLYAAP